MLTSYRTLFREPGTIGFSLAGLFARLPVSMTGIGLITMLSQQRDGYGIAAAVAATFALSTALLAPQIARLVDRYGQGRVLPVATTLSAAALLGLLICTTLSTADWPLFILAALAGCMPNMSAMVRARWTELFRGKPQLQTAYALEAVLDDVCFIVGPPLAVTLSVALFPEAEPLTSLIVLITGVTAFVVQKKTEPRIHPRTEDSDHAVIRLQNVQILTFLLFAMGAIVGTVDVVSVAFAKQQGNPAAAGIVLSVYAVGSCIAGLIFGTLTLKTPLPRLFLYCGLVTALTTVPMLLADTVTGLSIAVFFAGLSFAPTIIVAMSLIERTVPSAKLTEGMTWLITGLGIGISLGAVASGVIVDTYGATAGFWFSLGAGGIVLTTAVSGYGFLKRSGA